MEYSELYAIEKLLKKNIDVASATRNYTRGPRIYFFMYCVTTAPQPHEVISLPRAFLRVYLDIQTGEGKFARLPHWSAQKLEKYRVPGAELEELFWRDVADGFSEILENSHIARTKFTDCFRGYLDLRRYRSHQKDARPVDYSEKKRIRRERRKHRDILVAMDCTDIEEQILKIKDRYLRAYTVDEIVNQATFMELPPSKNVVRIMMIRPDMLYLRDPRTLEKLEIPQTLWYFPPDALLSENVEISKNNVPLDIAAEHLRGKVFRDPSGPFGNCFYLDCVRPNKTYRSKRFDVNIRPVRVAAFVERNSCYNANIRGQEEDDEDEIRLAKETATAGAIYYITANQKEPRFALKSSLDFFLLDVPEERG